LNFEEVSQHSDSGTPSRRRDLRKTLGSRRIHNVSESPEPRRGRFESPRKRGPKRKMVNFRQQKKCIKYHVEIHHIKQREGESTKDFVRRFKVESRDVKEAPKILRISGFMHGITKPEGEVATGNQERKNSIPPWKQQEARHKHNFKKGGKFKAPPPITTPVEKRNSNKFYEFLRELGHNTDECMHLKRQIEELLKNGKLSHVIRELKQNSWKDQPKENKKGETSKEEEGTERRMIIESEIGGHFIHQMYIDGGSALELYMTSLPRHIVEHRLNIPEGFRLVKQKRRGQAVDRNQAIQKEVEKLVDVGIIKEVHYHSWLSNLVMVKNNMVTGGCV
nr:reverse transcriptase domain-containing protein [Tanacetum cinerariifolium]